MQEALSGIIGAYERDFAKHPNISEFPKISMIWKSIPSQLARENKKFIYKVVKEGARAREYEDALQWLVDARLVHKIYRSSAPGLPVAAYDDLSAFKIYLVDVGSAPPSGAAGTYGFRRRQPPVYRVQGGINRELCASNFDYAV